MFKQLAFFNALLLSLLEKFILLYNRWLQEMQTIKILFFGAYRQYLSFAQQINSVEDTLSLKWSFDDNYLPLVGDPGKVGNTAQE